VSVPAVPPGPTEELPLLGEVFAVEFANTRYHSDREDLDFLSTTEAITTWFHHATTGERFALPRHLAPGTQSAIRQVRDATRQLLADAADRAMSAPTTEALDTLHHHAQRAPAHLALEHTGDAPPIWRVHHRGRAEDVLVAAIATQCILFLGGEDARKVRHCARPACPMFFVQRHRARRFCHETCAHSTRQARYYRSLHGKAADARHRSGTPRPRPS
jgi:predicted RNA-binding Zn ribbon-like protein